MNRQPLVSVLIPMYNAEETIESALESIQKQSYPNLEIICVDDGSDDATLSIVERRAELDRRIKPHGYKHRGVVYARNRSIELANGEYLVIMDADDISRLDRIEKQVKYMKLNPDIIASGSAFEEFDERGFLQTATNPSNHEILLFRQLRGIPVLHATSIIRRAGLLSSNIRYIEKYAYSEDYRLFFDLSRVGKLSNLPDVLYSYRRYPSQITAKHREIQKENDSEIRAEIYKFLCNNYGLNPASDKPKEWRRKIPRYHDVIWTFLWYIVTYNTDLSKLRKLWLVLFTHLRLTAKPRLILYIFFIRYTEKFTYSEDYRLFFDLYRVGKLGNPPDVLHSYRRDPSKFSTKYHEIQKKTDTEIRAEIYKTLCKKYGLNPASDKPKEWRRKFPRYHDAIWIFLWYIVTHDTGLSKLRKLWLVLFTHLRLTAKPRLILYIFFKKYHYRPERQ